MIFPYSSIIAEEPGSADYILFRRPEIPVTVIGPQGMATIVGLVDTGADNTVLPKSVAEGLGIPIDETTVIAASAFGGQRMRLAAGEVTFKLETANQTLAWKTTVSFFDCSAPDEETVVLGHAGFLDYFTATFDGKESTLTLIPNDELAVVDA